MSYKLTTNNLRTHFAKISSSKCFLGDFSKNKQIFLPPAPAFRITVPNGLRIIIFVLCYQHNAECCVFILVRLWWRVAEKLFQYEYPQKTAHFCSPYNTFDLLLMSLATLIFQRCVKPFTLVNKLGNWILYGTFLPLKKQYITVSICIYIICQKKKCVNHDANPST